MKPSIRISRSGMVLLQATAIRRCDLLVWTVYDHPKDFPDSYVVRPHSSHFNQPLSVHFVSDRLGYVRATLTGMGLTCIPRSDADDPTIVETWL